MSGPENQVNTGEVLAMNNRDQFVSLSNEFQGNIEMLSQRLNSRIETGLAQNLSEFENRLTNVMSGSGK